MKPYYESGGITIYHGNCEDVIPYVSTDIVVTSPPYNTLPKTHKPSGLHAQRKSGVNQWIKRASEGYEDTKEEGDYQDWLSGVVRACLGVSKGIVWVNHKIRYRDGVALHPARFLPFDLYSEIIWDRQGSMALNCKRYAPSHEGIWGFGKPNYWNDEHNTLMSVWRVGFDRDPNDHPCAYPLELPTRLILSSCPPGGTVLDPFMGSGTTMRSAKNVGRKGIGIEREERYCEMAVQRLAQDVLFGA